MDKIISVKGKDYELTSSYDSKQEAEQDADMFNHTGRWHTIVRQIDGKYVLYTRKLTDAKN